MDDSDALVVKINKASEIIAHAKYVIAFTGAGISVESGMPTFRGQGGLWGHYDDKHLDYNFFMTEPEISWKTLRNIFYTFTVKAEPNNAHSALASLEKHGYIKSIITQNIDGLHTKAGAKSVVEFHGSCTDLVCMQCGKKEPAVQELVNMPLPTCSCGGVYKPDFVFFGEGIPTEAYNKAYEASMNADVCLLIGSSGMVYPAASIPRIVKSHGGTIIEINLEPSEFTDSVTDIFIASKAGDAMSRIASAITNL